MLNPALEQKKCSARHIGFITNHIKTLMILPQSLKIELPGEKLSLVLNLHSETGSLKIAQIDQQLELVDFQHHDRTPGV
jgi:hypothetical protein